MIITSRCTIDVPSLGRLPTDKEVTISYGNPKREAVMGSNGFLGHSEEFTDPPSISCKLRDTSALDKQKLQGVVNETVTIIANNGQTWALNQAFMSEVIEIDASSGEIEIKFMGKELIEA
jgi:hypothetical protein